MNKFRVQGSRFNVRKTSSPSVREKVGKRLFLDASRPSTLNLELGTLNWPGGPI
jgi:hypothetical protein